MTSWVLILPAPVRLIRRGRLELTAERLVRSRRIAPAAVEALGGGGHVRRRHVDQLAPEPANLGSADDQLRTAQLCIHKLEMRIGAITNDADSTIRLTARTVGRIDLRRNIKSPRFETGPSRPQNSRRLKSAGIPRTGACPLASVAIPAYRRPVEQRKTVTVLFCDMVGSTALGEELDPETLRRIMNRYHAAARESIERHGGTVDRFIGDAVMAVFGIPLRREDDALRAVRAALDLRQSLERLNAQLEEGGVRLAIRIGVNTGEVFASIDDAETSAVGDAVNVAARLEQIAETGTIIIGPSTERLVRHAAHWKSLGAIQLKGKSKPVEAWLLLGLAEHTEAIARHLDSPLVGRGAEIALLEAALARAVEQRNCQLVTVIAPAGTGKSRMTREFVQRVEGRARVAAGRCLSYGEGITYWPVVQVIKTLAGVTDTDDTTDDRGARWSPGRGRRRPRRRGGTGSRPHRRPVGPDRGPIPSPPRRSGRSAASSKGTPTSRRS